MENLMELVRIRQDKLSMSTEQYANLIGITSVTLWRYYQGRVMSLENIRKMKRHYVETTDTEMVGALACYALDIDPQTKLTTIGDLLLSKIPSA